MSSGINGRVATAATTTTAATATSSSVAAGAAGGGASSSSALVVEHGGGGMLCNDPYGLCVAAQGPIPGAPPKTTTTGVYTNLTRLASKLGAIASKKEQEQEDRKPPLISIETKDKAILVKDYAGYAVAVQIPKTSSSSTAAVTKTAEEESKEASES